MASITLKDIPEDLHARLKAEAVAHARSLTKEILFRLSLSVSGAPGGGARAVASRARKVRKQFSQPLAPEDLKRYREQGRR